MTATMDPVKTEAAAGKVFGELGVFLSAPMLALGDRLGLFQELLEAGPLTSIELADRTGYVERYLREWLRAVAIGGYVTYDPDTRRFHLEPEMGAVLTDGSPISMIGVIPGLADLMNSLPAIEDFVRNGGGRGWRDAGPSVAAGQARFTRPMYLHGLVHEWLPAISGVAEKLQSGARVMDVGCGYGVSTALAAEAWPASTFVGTDIDPDSVTHATNAAAAPNVTFVAASATSYGGAAFDLVMMLDCLHDMGDPV
ncbi:MAG TPA: class I SAM-dependent methyltransferase, partial [Micromonosporaceae bacterium]